MSEQGASDQTAGQEPTTEEAWREVGQQFEALGESLSSALRAAWESDETQGRVRPIQDGLEKMIDKVEHAVKEARESRQGTKLRTEAEKTAETLRNAGEQTWEEARPQLVSLLKKVNAELQRLTRNLEEGPKAGRDPSQPPSGDPSGTASPEGQED